MCGLLVGLPDVNVLGVELNVPIRVHVETAGERPFCEACGAAARVKDRPVVELVDLSCFGRPARLVWHKRRWCCANVSCAVGSWTEDAPGIASPRLTLTDRAGRWVTEQVGRWGRTVNELAVELDADWHTINDAVVAYGTPLVDDPARIGSVRALGLDEVLYARLGRWRRQVWSTSIVDVGRGQLLDVIEGRSAATACEWLAARPQDWLDAIRWAVLDLSGPWRLAFDTMLPAADQVADPFHLVKVRHEALCVRGWVRGPPCRSVAADR
jgi:transposase